MQAFIKSGLLFIKFDPILDGTGMTERCNILITGGTSGLGLELVKLFLSKGYFVVTTGRRVIEMTGSGGRFKSYQVDFADLYQTAEIFKEICKISDFDYVVYNAGILSPPEFIRTKNGYEYTYQVNFLAHLLANEIIIQNHDPVRPLRIAAVISMAYRVAAPEFKPAGSPSGYKAWKAYSDSKLYLALMCLHYSAKFADRQIQLFSFDPGIFGSKLYRTQSGIFRMIYQVGVRILRKPVKPAVALSEILTGSDVNNGAVYDVRKRIRRIPEPELSYSETFWDNAMEELTQILK